MHFYYRHLRLDIEWAYTIAVIFMLVGSVIHWTTLWDYNLVWETVPELNNFLIHHHLHFCIRHTPIINKLICKILKRNETNNSIHIPVMLYDYLGSLQNLLLHHLTTQKKSTSISTSKKTAAKQMIYIQKHCAQYITAFFYNCKPLKKL